MTCWLKMFASKMTAVALLALVVTAAIPSYGQSPIKVYLGGGVTSLQKPQGLADSVDLGYALMVGLGYSSMPGLQLVGKYEYHRFSNDVTAGGLAVNLATTTITMYGLQARLGPPLPAGSMKPFITGGIGLARFSRSAGIADLIVVLPEIPAKTEFYYDIGGGLEFASQSMVKLFVQVRYVSISTDNARTVIIPVTIGLRLF